MPLFSRIGPEKIEIANDSKKGKRQTRIWNIENTEKKDRKIIIKQTESKGNIREQSKERKQKTANKVNIHKKETEGERENTE